MKKFLLATAAVLASTSAYAADYAVVHPFYTPAQGKFVSTTELEYEHTAVQDKGFDWKVRTMETTLSETVKYGVTNDIQVGLTIGRDWGKLKEKDAAGTWTFEPRSYTNSWGLSAGYNIINDGKAFLNVGLQYSQIVVQDGGDGKTDDDEHGKFIDLEVSGGYNFDDVTVFGSIDYTRQVDGEKEGFLAWPPQGGKDSIYTLEAGVFKAFNDQISARTSLEIEIDRTKDERERTYWWNIGADYSISKKMAVGVDFGYMLKNDKDYNFAAPTPETDMHSAYKLSVDFTVEF